MQNNWLVLLSTLIAASGCAGVTIKPVAGTPETVRQSLITDKKDGYVIYHPMIAFEIVDKEVCVTKGSNGACTEITVTCALGTRYILPDYEQPYVVQITSGLGKAGVDVSFTEGWLLSNVKDNSDNTALLETLFKAAGVGGYKATRTPEDKGCKDRGLYRYKLINNKPTLCRFWSPNTLGFDCK